MVVGSNLVNAFNYFYHLIIGRMLGPVGYSELVLGYLMALVLTFWQLRKYYKHDASTKIDRADILKYALPVFLQSMAMMSLMSVDIILVRHLFSAETAGIYAGMSTMGRIIFYASGAVGSVMFPLVSARYARGQAYRGVFMVSLVIVSLMVAGLS